MIKKTLEFINKFFIDFSNVVFYKKNYDQVIQQFYNNVAKKSREMGISYEEAMNKELENRDTFTDDPHNKGYKKFPPLFKFVGSFATKDFGKIMSDIDIGQSPNFRSEGVMIRLREIIDKTNPATKSPNMPFYFIRFYLGTIKGYEPPWEYNQQGNCEFDISQLDNWLIKIKELVPIEVFDKINEKLSKDTLSLKDLVEVDDMTKKYTSITWLTQDVQRGYKDLLGVRYNLLELLQDNSSKIIVKFIYEYKNEDGSDRLNSNLKKDYMLIDLSLNQTRGDLISLTYYYLNDSSYKFKSLKRYLPEELVQRYRDDFGENAGYLTTVGTRLDLLDKIQRYNFNETIMSKQEFLSLREDLNNFAASNGYTKINPNFRNQTIKEMDHDVQSVIENIRQDLFKYYEQKVTNRKEEFYYYLLRGEEASLQISKEIIEQRIKDGIKCPFFFLDGKNLKLLVNFAIKFNFDPVKLIFCINSLSNITGYDSSVIFNNLNPESFELEQLDNDKYILYENKLLLRTNSVEDLNAVFKNYNLNLTYRNREYSLFENNELLVKERIIQEINLILQSRGMYLRYDHYSEYRYSLYQLHIENINDISLEQVQKILIEKLLK